MVHPLVGALGGHLYRVAVSANRPAVDYTVRIIPHFGGVAISLEDARILGQL